MFPVPEHGKGVLHSSVWDLSTPPIASSSQKTAAGPSETTKQQESASTDETTEESVEVEQEETAESKWKKTSSLPEGIEPGTVDIAVMIFVMSALHPMEWQRAIANAYKVSLDGS